MKKICIIVVLFSYISLSALDQPIIIISIPKSGLHLFSRFLELYLQKQMVYIKDLASLESAYSSTNNSFFCTHFPYYSDIEEFLNTHNFKVFFVVRHPGDVLVSFAHWVHSYYSLSVTLSEMITYLMVNGSLIYTTFSPFKTLLWGIADYYNHFIPWHNRPQVCTIKFENLIGAQGGGDPVLQKKEILKIVNYLEMEISTEKYNEVIHNLFGGTMTFREGVIGAWKRVFTPEQKHYFITNIAINTILQELNYPYEEAA